MNKLNRNRLLGRENNIMFARMETDWKVMFQVHDALMKK